jgi:hypothetical protein
LFAVVQRVLLKFLVQTTFGGDMKMKLNLIAIGLLVVSAASAGTVTSLYSQINCFNLSGVTSCPDGSNWQTGLGGVFFTDYRTPAEVTAGSVADIWAGPENVSWNMPSYSAPGAVSATFSMQIAGIADTGGPYTVLFDNTSIGVIPINPLTNAFQEVLTYTYSVPVGLLDGADTIAINNTVGDGYIIGYALLTVTTGGVATPEPATFGLLLLGAGALGVAKARRFFRL